MTADPTVTAIVPPAPPAIHGEGLRMTYRKRTVVDVAEITIASGETYALLGASGAGKSTLLRMLGLLEAPSAGTVSLDGRKASRHNLRTRRTIAAVFQKPYLLRGTVGYNVGYGLKLRHVPKAERAARVAEVLERVGLAGWERRSALTLSGGEAQRVALARALVLKPGVLLLDEPLSYMDPLLKRELTAEFARILASEHVTAIYVTHDQDEAAVVADRIGVMRDGRIVAQGAPDEVLGLPADPWVASFIGMEPAIEGRIVSVEDGLATIDAGGVVFHATTALPVGTEVLLAVRPEDVTLYPGGTELPTGSARNRIAAVVADIRPGGASSQVVLVAGGSRIVVAVSRASIAELKLAAGSHVIAVFKATAVRVAERMAPPLS